MAKAKIKQIINLQNKGYNRVILDNGFVFATTQNNLQKGQEVEVTDKNNNPFEFDGSVAANIKSQNLMDFVTLTASSNTNKDTATFLLNLLKQDKQISEKITLD